MQSGRIGGTSEYSLIRYRLAYKPCKAVGCLQKCQAKTISNTTIKRYIDYFCGSFLIDNAVRYDIKGKKYIDTPVKYFFTDLGLCNACLNFRQLEETHAMEK